MDSVHYELVASELLAGYVIPFLGAGANLAERPPNMPWQLGAQLPSGMELARELADRSRYPDDGIYDLQRVSQYVDAMLGESTLYRFVRSLFDADYPPNSLHRFLAAIPGLLRARQARHPLIVTTNYDDAVERAFVEVGEEFDLVWYEAKPRNSAYGKFIHRPPGRRAVAIELPNEYDDLSLQTRSVILKLHGAIDRTDPKRDSYVITEDDYIDYLTRGDVSIWIPSALREAMEDSHFLFLGYSMRDWNLRVILNRIWGQQQLDVKSWAVQKAHPNAKHNEVEQRLWRDRGDVDRLEIDLADYMAKLHAEVLTQAGSPAAS